MTPHDPHNHTDSDLKEKQFVEHSPERSADFLTKHIVSSLKRDYFIIGKRRIRSWHAWLMVGVLAGGTFTLVLVANRSGRFDASLASNTAQTNASPAAMTQAQQVNALRQQSISLRLLQKQYRHVSGKHSVEDQMRNAVQDRLDIMERLIQRNPKAAFRQRIIPPERASYPDTIKSLLEEDVNLEGKLEIIHGHDVQNNSSFTEFFLVRANERIQLHFIDPPHQNLIAGMKVRVQGMRVRNQIGLSE